MSKHPTRSTARARRLGACSLAAALLMLAGCGGAGGGASNEVKIAIAGPMTGSDAQYGQDFWRGASLAAKAVNAKSKDTKVTLKKFDDVDDTTQAANVAQKIASDSSIDAVVGHFTTPTVFATMPIYKRNQIPQLVVSASNPDITKRGDKWLYRVSPPITFNAGVVAKALKHKVHPKKVAALYLNTDYGTADHSAFLAAAKKQGLHVVLNQSYQPDTKDFTNLVLKLKSMHPDAIYLSSYYNDAALIVKQAAEAGVDGLYFSPGSLYSPAYVKVGGDSVEGNTYTLSVPHTAQWKNAVKTYKKKYQATPDQFALYSYSAVQAIAEAATKNGVDRSSIRDGLDKLDGLATPVGPLGFNANGQYLPSKLSWITVRQGHWQLAKLPRG